MSSSLDLLSRLAVLHGTDKFGYHDYTPNYFDVLQHLSEAPIRLLEIGVGGYGDADRGGESLAVWRDFFPNAEIVIGIDIQKKTLDLGPRVKILQGSQVDEAFLEELCETHGPFDVIIDDGSHRNEHVVESFHLLYPKLADGGIYIAEDVQTAFHPRFGGSLELTPPNSVGFFSDLMLDVMKGACDWPIDRIDRFHNIFVAHKTRPEGATAGQVVPSVWEDRRLRDALLRQGAKIGLADGAEVPSDVLADLAAAGIKPNKLTVKPKSKSSRQDVVIAGSRDGKSGAAVTNLWDSVTEGGFLVVAAEGLEPSLEKFLKTLFVQIDHKEINVHFPDAEILPEAPKTYSAHALRDGIILRLGENTYPSNFQWTIEHPRAAAAVAHMESLLEEPNASETGLLQVADILYRHRSPEAALPFLERLKAEGCRMRRYFQMMGQHYQAKGVAEQALLNFEAALEAFPNDPQFTANLGNSYIRAGRVPDAEALFRTVLAANDRARGPMVQLSKLLERRGEFEEALDLAERSINLFPRHQRAQRLEDLAKLAEKAGEPDRAAAALERVQDLE